MRFGLFSVSNLDINLARQGGGDIPIVIGMIDDCEMLRVAGLLLHSRLPDGYSQPEVSTWDCWKL